MTHQWHDTYRHASTPAHHLDPRSKLLVGLLCVGTILCTPHWGRSQIVGYPILLTAAAFMARLSPYTLLKRVLGILPFAIIMLLSAMLSRLSYVHVIETLLKAVLSVAAMALVSMTTPFPDLLRALEQCRTPQTLILFLAFLYRYTAVLGKEIVRAERGWSSRTFGRFWWREWTRAGHVLAALLIRSYERAERVYAAMLGRGFSNRMPAIHLLHFGLGDFLFVCMSASLLLTVCMVRF